MLKKFVIKSNSFLNKNIEAFYSMDYIIMEQNPKSNCLNQFKNTFNTSIQDNSAVSNLQKILLEDLMNFSNLTVCIVPRAKAENTYSRN